MSRFRNVVSARDNHIFTLRMVCVMLFTALVTTRASWMLAPRDLTIHNPPDLRSGSTKKWWEVPPSTVYSFAFYIFQQLNVWPKDGEVDYPAKIAQMSPYLTPACQDFLNKDAEYCTNSGELKDRVRVVYEIPKRGYSSKSVDIKSNNEWVARLSHAICNAFLTRALSAVSDIDQPAVLRAKAPSLRPDSSSAGQTYVMSPHQT